jgi:hypothetical protein
MYVNAEMIPATTRNRGEDRINESGEGGIFKYDIFDTL